MNLLNRDEIRLLISLRTGHCRLPYFQYHELDQGISDRCWYCDEPGTIEHFFLECGYDPLVNSRRYLFDLTRKCYLEAIDSASTKFDVNIQDINFYFLGTYLFPPRNMGEHYWSLILRDAVRHGRQCLYFAKQSGDEDL